MRRIRGTGHSEKKYGRQEGSKVLACFAAHGSKIDVGSNSCLTRGLPRSSKNVTVLRGAALIVNAQPTIMGNPPDSGLPPLETSSESDAQDKLCHTPRKRLSQVVDKLGRSMSGSVASSPGHSSPRRLFSIKRKNRASIDGAASDGTHNFTRTPA